MADQSLIMSVGMIDLKPGVFRVSHWVRDFIPMFQKHTNAQIWVHIFNVFSIARAAGLPLKIDKMTLRKDNCMFVRVLVDVDLASTLPDRVLVKRKQLNFFVDLAYKNLPVFCSKCCVSGHTSDVCRKDGEVNLHTELRRNITSNPDSIMQSKKRVDANRDQGKEDKGEKIGSSGEAQPEKRNQNQGGKQHNESSLNLQVRGDEQIIGDKEGSENIQVLSKNPFEILGNAGEEIEAVLEAQAVGILVANRGRIPT